MRDTTKASAAHGGGDPDEQGIGRRYTGRSLGRVGTDVPREHREPGHVDAQRDVVPGRPAPRGGRRRRPAVPTPATSTTRRTCSGVDPRRRDPAAQGPVGVHDQRRAPQRDRGAGGTAYAARPRRAAGAPRPGRPPRPRARARSRGTAPSPGRPGLAHTSAIGALLHDPALAHHGQPVGEREGLLVVVGDDQRGRPGGHAGRRAARPRAARAGRRRGRRAARRAAAAGAGPPGRGPGRRAAARRRTACRAAGRRSPASPTRSSSSATRRRTSARGTRRSRSA